MAEATEVKPLNETISGNKIGLIAQTAGLAVQSHDSDHDNSRYFETAHWSADGTTVLTTSSSNTVSAHVLPPDLLEDRTEPLTLSPQVSIQLGEPSNVLTSAPYFNLSEAYTNQVLVSSRDHPIQLYYLFPPAVDDGAPQPKHSPAAAYPLIKAHSETFLTANALLWPAPGSHFIAGCKNFLAKFDLARPGEEPLLRIKTIPSERHLSKGNGVGMRGTISTLSAQSSSQGYESLVAAGTWTRWIGLYDFMQAGECAATWSIASAARETAPNGGSGIGGDGISQTCWSPCGRYLLVSERKSRGILIYDIRVTGQLLGWLEDRNALTNQRITCDVFASPDDRGGFEVWSGTTSGIAKVWEHVGLTAGAQQPSWEWQAHESTIGSTCLHPAGSVVATCSGSWEFGSGDGGSDQDLKTLDHNGIKTMPDHDDKQWLKRRTRESTLKIWNLKSNDGN